MAGKNRSPDHGVRLLDYPYRSARVEGRMCDGLPPLHRWRWVPAPDPEL